MAWQVVNANRTTLLNLFSSDSVSVGAGFTVSNSGGTGINTNGDGQQVHLFGTVIASGTGLYMGSASTTNVVFIGATGIASGGTDGIVFSGSGHSLLNYGLITSGNYGMEIVGTAANNLMQNYGTIYGAVHGVFATTSGSGEMIFKNFGTITGGNNSYRNSSSTTSDVIYNSGTMTGDVFLGGGTDKFISKGAGMVIGAVFGEGGDDQFTPGTGIDSIYGGSGTDYLFFSDGPAIKIALDESFDNTGVAEGDYYREIEGVYGSRFGDVITGDGLTNVLVGNAGVDTLSGGDGADQINGGAGKDVLTGGTGDDAFIFNQLADGGDVIKDFSNKVGNNDRFEISSAELTLFGILGARDLLAAEFYVGKTNICTGTEDRIIVRTTDNTVWFDSNGKAAGGLTMLADLQAGVTLTYQDFHFF